ncbi:MAG: hypothetical protein EKK33_01555 [Bradyrhizobiaceae bacterium]|nr:MAG: hypothetical protein EKK33_01555 [Bradyrhizobiaceae bacterium]
MCEEKNWRDCHRQIIADHLLIAGHQVIHLVDAKLQEEATLTSFGLRSTGGTIRYPASLKQLRLDF